MEQFRESGKSGNAPRPAAPVIAKPCQAVAGRLAWNNGTGPITFNRFGFR
jgi:hypothetical protein